MASWIYRATLVAIAALAPLAACSDDETTTGAGGAGATGGQGGQGGGGGDPGCVPAECPQPESECEFAICIEDTCSFGDVAAGTSCAEGACDGEGNCVDHCSNGEQDFSETDVDCGGACEPCAVGEACIVEEDCTSGFCIDLLCCQTACDGVCEACDLAGSEGTCSPHPQGTDPDDDCAPLSCNGAGACE